jgi:hypothetical protein
MDNFTASGVFNPRELSSSSKGVKFSDLSGSRSNSTLIAVTDSILSTDQFSNLRRFDIDQAKHDVALSLINLESYRVYISRTHQSSIDASLAFEQNTFRI